MSSRVHSSAEKSNISINTTLVARQQTAQTVNASKSELSEPKFDFHLSNISISSPDRPSHQPPRINPKLGNKKFLNQSERETEPKNPVPAIQTFAPSTPAQPSEEDEAEKQLQKQELTEKSKSQQPPSDSPGKLESSSGSSMHLNKMPISAPRRPLKTPPVQPKLKVSIAPRNRLQQQVTEKREEPPAEDIQTKAIASPASPPDAPGKDNHRTSAIENSQANIAISTPDAASLAPPVQLKLTISTPGDRMDYLDWFFLAYSLPARRGAIRRSLALRGRNTKRISLRRSRLAKNPTTLLSRKQFFAPSEKMSEP